MRQHTVHLANNDAPKRPTQNLGTRPVLAEVRVVPPRAPHVRLLRSVHVTIAPCVQLCLDVLAGCRYTNLWLRDVDAEHALRGGRRDGGGGDWGVERRLLHGVYSAMYSSRTCSRGNTTKETEHGCIRHVRYHRRPSRTRGVSRLRRPHSYSSAWWYDTQSCTKHPRSETFQGCVRTRPAPSTSTVAPRSFTYDQ